MAEGRRQTGGNHISRAHHLIKASRRARNESIDIHAGLNSNTLAPTPGFNPKKGPWVKSSIGRPSTWGSSGSRPKEWLVLHDEHPKRPPSWLLLEGSGRQRPQSWLGGSQFVHPDELEETSHHADQEASDGELRDPQHPRNWASKTKWSVVGALSWISFVTPLASSLIAPVAPQIQKDLHITSSTLSTFTVSAYMLGSAVGPVCMAPLSEIYGRTPVYHFSNVAFLIFSLSCSFSQTGPQLIVLRFLESCLGTACLTIGGATVADLFPPEKRASAMGGWSLGPLLGPAIGPVLGGIIGQHLNWRWIFRILAIVAALDAMLCFFLLRETYWPLLKRRKEQQEDGVKAQGWSSKECWALPRDESLWRSMSRPLRLLTMSPVVTLICLYAAAVFGIMFMLFTTIGFVFPQYYNFSEQQSGLVYLAIGLGMVFGLGAAAKTSDRLAGRKKNQNEEDDEENRPLVPEARIPLWTSLVGALAVSGGLVIYGWIIQCRIHWAGAIVGLFLIGWGVLWLMIPVQQYLIESFPIYASSALAANAFLRSLTTGLLPLSGLGLYDKLGMGWGNTLLAGIMALSAALPELCRCFGARLRERFPV